MFVVATDYDSCATVTRGARNKHSSITILVGSSADDTKRNGSHKFDLDQYGIDLEQMNQNEFFLPWRLIYFEVYVHGALLTQC